MKQATLLDYLKNLFSQEKVKFIWKFFSRGSIDLAIASIRPVMATIIALWVSAVLLSMVYSYGGVPEFLGTVMAVQCVQYGACHFPSLMMGVTQAIILCIYLAILIAKIFAIVEKKIKEMRLEIEDQELQDKLMEVAGKIEA